MIIINGPQLSFDISDSLINEPSGVGRSAAGIAFTCMYSGGRKYYPRNSFFRYTAVFGLLGKRSAIRSHVVANGVLPGVVMAPYLLSRP